MECAAGLSSVGRPLPSMEALGTAQRASYPDYEGTTADGPVLVQRRSQTFTPFELADPDFPLGAITYFLHVCAQVQHCRTGNPCRHNCLLRFQSQSNVTLVQYRF